MIISHEDLFKEILFFCKKNKYLDKLEQSLKISEHSRFSNKKIVQSGLDILDAVHCVVDKNRTWFFLKEIKRFVNSKTNVLEAGIGTGILSFYSAILGARVHGLELNKEILKLAQKIQTDLEKKKILQKGNPLFFKKNALAFHEKNKFNVIISENIYTGMLYEKQVEITNHLRKNLSKRGVFIPSSMENWIQFCKINDETTKVGELIVINEKIAKKIQLKKITPKKKYSILNFKEKLPTCCNEFVQFYIKKDYLINAVVIKSDIFMPSGRKIVGSQTIFFNNDILIKIKPIQLKANMTYKVLIKYKYGSKPENIKFIINVI